MIDEAMMARGTGAARYALGLGIAFLVVLLILSYSASFAGDPVTLSLIWLFSGIAYLLKAWGYQVQWRPTTVSVAAEGFTAPQRSFLAALRGQQGKLVRWEDIARVGLIPAGTRWFFARPNIDCLGVKTKNGWLHWIFENDSPDAYARLSDRLKDKIEKPGKPSDALPGEWLPQGKRG